MRPLWLDTVTDWLSRRENAFPLTEVQLSQLSLFKERLLEANQYMNLTAITEDEAIAKKHFIDSLSLLPWITPGAKLLDIGAGAGFPGLPLKIARPDIHLTLLDSLRKRILFLRETADALNLDNVECVHARAEEINKTGAYRARSDICTARAVARLDRLAGYALPFLKPGGLFLAMKGPDAADEIKEAEGKINKLGGRVLEIRAVEIAEGMKHSVVVVEAV